MIVMKDLIIIGSGPAGLSAAVYAVRAGLDVCVIEQNSMSGGQILNTYEVDNYLGLPGINGFDMGKTFRDHADKLGVEFIKGKVKEVIDEGEVKTVKTRKDTITAKTIIFAMGASHAKLSVPGEEEFTGRGVSYCATCDGAFYKDKEVVVVGGGDVALEDAIYLARIAKKVTVVHRRDTFRGASILEQELKEYKNVEFAMNNKVSAIEGEMTVNKIILEDATGECVKSLSADGIFIAVGNRPSSELVEGLVELDEAGYIVAGEDCVTNVPGMFAAGDIRTKKMRQIVTAVADGANAVNSVREFLK